MATDFNNKAVLGKPSFVGNKNLNDLPLDARIRIDTLDEVSMITFPYVGMLFYIRDEEKFYVVKSLKGEEQVPGIAATFTPNYKIDVYEEFKAGTSLDEETLENLELLDKEVLELLDKEVLELLSKDTLEALGVPYREAIPEIPGTSVPEHYDKVAQGTPGAKEVVADDFLYFDENSMIKVSDANAMALPGVSFEVGDYALFVDAVEGTDPIPEQPEQEATGLFKTVMEMAEEASVLASDINVYGIGEIGGVKDGDVFAMGSTLDDVVKKIFQADPTGVPAVYVEPEVTIEMDPAEIEQEVGTTITPKIKATFVQNDGGAETYRVFSPVNNAQQNQIQIAEGENQQYSVTVNYAQGPQKLDSVGKESGTPIPAGSAFASFNYIGYRNMFFGGDTGSGTNFTSDEVRALPVQVKVGSQEAVEFKVPVGTTRVIAAVPSSVAVEAITYVEQGADYMDLFTKASTRVAGLNNYASVAYWVYVYNIPVALEGVMTFRVVLG